MKARAGRIEQQPRESFFLHRYMGGGIGGFYLVIMGRWYLYVDWIR